jgi:hypothetical protein
MKTGNWMTHLEFDLESPIWRHLYRRNAPTLVKELDSEPVIRTPIRGTFPAACAPAASGAANGPSVSPQRNERRFITESPDLPAAAVTAG